MGGYGYRKPAKPRHMERRSGRATARFQEALDGPVNTDTPLAPEAERHQGPTGWALKRRRAVQAVRLRHAPSIIGALLLLAVLVVVAFGLRDMAQPRDLLPLAENREAYDALADFGARGEAPGQTRTPAPEAVRLAWELRVYRVVEDEEGTIVMIPRSGLKLQYARYQNGAWDTGKLPFSTPD